MFDSRKENPSRVVAAVNIVPFMISFLIYTTVAPTGEMLRPIAAPEAFFNSERAKLRGMNETVSKVNVKHEYCGDQESLKKRVYEIANVAQVPCVLGNNETGTPFS